MQSPALTENRLNLETLFWPLRWRYACGCQGVGRCVGADPSVASRLVEQRALRVCFRCEALATAEVLHLWLADRFTPAAPFLLQRYNTRALGLGLTVEQATRVAVLAYRGERAAEVTS